MRRTLLRFLAALVAAGVLVACAGDNDEESSSTAEEDTAAVSTDAEHNDADVTFAQMMIPHHQQALEMAQLAPSRAQDPRVLDLARRIEDAQTPEIDQMESWLEAWGADDGDMGDMDHDMGSGEGMMSEADMAALDAASGTDFDIMFLDLMIEHHRGAIAMADTQLQDGENAEALALAEQIAGAQTDEISEMEQILAETG
jgi:uncharacterized protein (DUF305 family)